MAKIKLSKFAFDAAEPQAQAIELNATLVTGFCVRLPAHHWPQHHSNKVSWWIGQQHDPILSAHRALSNMHSFSQKVQKSSYT